MGEAGVFAPGARLELMDGEIVEMAPIGSAHAAVVNALSTLLSRSLLDCIVSMQNPLVLDDLTVPQPDISVLKNRDDKYFRAHPRPADALLVVEVADSTLRFDLEAKVPLYARAGVRETWVVDIEKRAIHVCRELVADRYLTCTQYAGHQIIEFQGITVRVSDLFPL